MWETFGGSCWEISRFLGDVMMRAQEGKVPGEAFEEEITKVCIQMRSMYVNYAGLYKGKRALLKIINAVVRAQGRFREEDMASLVDNNVFEVKDLRDELGILVGQNFISYNPVTAEYAVQGRSMEIGLAMYADMIAGA